MGGGGGRRSSTERKSQVGNISEFTWGSVCAFHHGMTNNKDAAGGKANSNVCVARERQEYKRGRNGKSGGKMEEETKSVSVTVRKVNCCDDRVLHMQPESMLLIIHTLLEWTSVAY